MQPGDAERGGVDTVALQLAVAQDLPGFRARDDVLDAGADLLVGAVVFALPVAQFAAGWSAAWDDQPGAGLLVVSE